MNGSMNVTDDLFAAITIRSGDKVLLLCGKLHVSAEWAQQVTARLKERFPDVEFTFLSGVSQALVQHAEVGA